jgi:hypothetical protein
LFGTIPNGTRSAGGDDLYGMLRRKMGYLLALPGMEASFALRVASSCGDVNAEMLSFDI